MSNESMYQTPFSQHDEMSVLSCIAKGGIEELDYAIELGISEDLFFLDSNALAFRTMRDDITENGSFQLMRITTNEKLEANFKKAYGVSWVSQVTEIYTYSTATDGVLERSIPALIDLHAKRTLIKRLDEVKENLYDPDLPASEATGGIAAEIDDIIQSTGEKNGTQANLKQIFKNNMKRIADAIQGKSMGILTGFRQIDSMTGGLMPTEISIIAARPSVGKTAFAMSIINNVCLVGGISTMFFSIEMDKDSIGMRTLSAKAGVNLGLISKKPTKSTLKTVKETSIAFSDAPIIIDDQNNITASEIRAKARVAVRKHGVKIIFVDYLQYISGETPKERSEPKLRVANALKTLKNIARDLKVHVCVLAQLNRDAENARYDQLHHAMIAECGNAEQDADVIFLLGKDKDAESKLQPDQETVREVVISKQRNGATGMTGGVIFKKECATFEDIPPQRWKELSTFR